MDEICIYDGKYNDTFKFRNLLYCAYTEYSAEREFEFGHCMDESIWNPSGWFMMHPNEASGSEAFWGLIELKDWSETFATNKSMVRCKRENSKIHEIPLHAPFPNNGA